jgi:hypothetical protein
LCTDGAIPAARAARVSTAIAPAELVTLSASPIAGPAVRDSRPPWAGPSPRGPSVQYACNLLNGAGLSVDGAWGSLTQTANQNLLSKFKMTCLNPRTSSWSTQEFLHLIMRAAFRNQSAGFYTYAFC